MISVFKVFRVVMAKFRRETNLYRRVRSVQNFLFQQSSQITTDVSQKSLTIWSREMNHRKVEKVTYRIGIR
jgi:hypothetical protein